MSSFPIDTAITKSETLRPSESSAFSQLSATSVDGHSSFLATTNAIRKNMSSRTTSPTSLEAANSPTLRSLTAEARLKELSAKSDLSGKVILLFGSCLSTDHPIASSTATRLSAHGAQLVLVEVGGKAGATREAGLQKLAGLVDGAALHGNRWHCGRDGKWTRVQKATVYRLEEDFAGSVEALLKSLIDSFGRLDGLVFMPSSSSSSTSSSSALSSPSLMTQLEARIAEELLILVQFIQSAVPYLETSGSGAIVTVSTTVALKPDAQQLVTAISRSAIDMLLKCLALELGPKKVRLNSINHIPATATNSGAAFVPGLEVNQSLMDAFVAQQEAPGKRSLRGEDVAAAVLYLLTPRSSFLNGTNLVIDGGQTL